MPFYEYVGNLHVHTTHSDGTATHEEVGRMAARAGLDFVITTDHNVRVRGVEGYHDGTLLLTGEEIHDVERRPQGNHLLVYGVDADLVQKAAAPQDLLHAIQEQGGSAYIAHPTDKPLPRFGEHALPWEDWDLRGFTGLEVWNYMSSLKPHLDGLLSILNAVFRPHSVLKSPDPDTLALWDRLLSEGRRVAAIGSADAHGMSYSIGPLHKQVFPYEFLFRQVNTHALALSELSGTLEIDRKLIFGALREGRTFLSNGAAGDARGFRFSATGEDDKVGISGEIKLKHGVTLQVKTPARADIRIIHAGKGPTAEQTDVEALVHIADEPGAYRVEVWRGDTAWIFSSPIYIR